MGDDIRVKRMPYDEWKSKYPDGGPTHFSGRARSEEYLEFRSAVSRRDFENNTRPALRKAVVWALVLLLVFTVGTATGGSPIYGVFAVLAITLCGCFVGMGMNLPPHGRK